MPITPGMIAIALISVAAVSFVIFFLVIRRYVARHPQTKDEQMRLGMRIAMFFPWYFVAAGFILLLTAHFEEHPRPDWCIYAIVGGGFVAEIFRILMWLDKRVSAMESRTGHTTDTSGEPRAAIRLDSELKERP